MMRRTTTLVVLTVVGALAVPGAALGQESDVTVRDQSTERSADGDAGRDATRDELIRELKARAQEAIADRLAVIDRLEEKVAGNDHVSSEHARVLQDQLAAAATGLGALAAEIEAAAEPETLRVLVPQIVEDYRIYVLVAPKVHLVLAGDIAAAAAERLGAAAGKIGEAIARAEEAGFEVEAASAALRAMEANIAEGAEKAAAIAPAVIDLVPADWPEAKETLQAAKDTAQSAFANLRQAGADGREAVELLGQALGREGEERDS